MRLGIALLMIGCGSSPRPSPSNKALPDARVELTDDAVANPRARAKFSLQVLGLVVSNTNVANAGTIATQLTTELRAIARQDDRVALSNEERDLLDQLIMNNCTTAQTPCMARIARGLRVDRMIYGELTGSPLALTIWLLDAKTEQRVEWATNVNTAKLSETARESVKALLVQMP